MPEVTTVQELAAQVAANNINTMIWIVGALFSIVLGLIGFVWKGNSNSIARQAETITLFGNTLATHTNQITEIQSKCKTHDSTAITETQIRRIFREETQSLKESLSDSIRLKLIEDGYLDKRISS